MANLSNYDPFNTRLNKFFNHIFSNNRPLLDEWQGMQASNIKMDVAEDDKGYSVRAELPGFKKEDIHVQVDGNQVTISAETESKKEEKKDKNLICCERYEGKMFRSFVLDSDIDEANAEAEFVDGVLALTLPKKVGGDSSRQLTVK